MTTKEFVEKAVEGGWEYCNEISVYDDMHEHWFVSDGDGGYVAVPESDILLDPRAWKAVWNTKRRDKDTNLVPIWQDKMHDMIDHLVSGGTITSYIETL